MQSHRRRHRTAAVVCGARPRAGGRAEYRTTNLTQRPPGSGADRSRKDPVAKVEHGHRSAVIGHLIIIAMFVGRKLQWDAAKEVFTGDGAKEANTHLAREMRKPYDYSYVA